MHQRIDLTLTSYLLIVLLKCSDSRSIHFNNLVFFTTVSGNYASSWKQNIRTPIPNDGQKAEITKLYPIASLFNLSLEFENIR